MKIKARTKRPPKPEPPVSKAKKILETVPEERKVKPKATGAKRDPRVDSIVEEVMR